MTRSLSLAALEAAQAQETGEVYLALVTLTHADPTFETKRYVRNTTDVVSRGQTFTAVAFDISLPDEDDEGSREVQLVLDNVDRRDVEAVRRLTSPLQVLLEVVLASQPDVVETQARLGLRGVQIDAATIAGTLADDPFLHLRYPAATYSQADYPGLFG